MSVLKRAGGKPRLPAIFPPPTFVSRLGCLPSEGSPVRRCLPFVFVILCLAGARAAAQPLIAETPALSPAEEKAKLHVPPGFEIQLVASEPEIHKPINLRFDAHGRLWVSNTIEYPFPAPDPAKARDAICIFSNFDASGKAQTVQRFAEHLNIPIGLFPMSDREALAWSIPNIYRLTDTDGDGVADKKTVLFGPFGVVDTHGDQNAFTRWIDGWMYANHGFSNDSRVKLRGTGQEVLHMQSGNTYRFRPDGSAIEQYSWGQVNPFGLSFDALGNLYSADCHSRAVSLLLREGYYQSFGKPHDGLGFAPDTTTLDHGGTGIAGVAYGSLPDFPARYRDVLYVGNVITTRVHCDRVKWTGSSPTVTAIEDFLVSDDPWFRPVDLQQGPDGALYVADFYNCIIGHYEVPLTHPKRDRERGRIWRIVYKGEPGKPAAAKSAPMPDLTSLDARALFAQLKHPNLAVRVLATNLLVDKFPQEAAAMAGKLLLGDLAAAKTNTDVSHARFAQASHAVWLLQRTAGLSQQIATKLLGDETPADVQVHVVKALGETANWQPWQFDLVRGSLRNADPFVRRAGAEALSKHPAQGNLLPLLAVLDSSPADDPQLVHGTRIALRDQLRDADVVNSLLKLKLQPAQRKKLVEFAATAPSGPAALLVFDEALRGNISDDVLVKAMPVGARFVDSSRVDPLVANIQKRFASYPALQISLLRSLADGLGQRGVPQTPKLRATLTEQIRLALAADSDAEWFNTPLPGNRATPSPWGPQARAYRDGDTTMMISSLAEGGEKLGGVLRSPSFELPPQLSFWMCGHDGRPNEPARKQNFIRLVLADGTEVARTYPPRKDQAQRFEWHLADYAGKRGHIEVVDGITDLDGFAWIAVARFEPEVVTLPDHPVGEEGSDRADLYRLAARLKLTSLTNQIATASEPSNSNLTTRLAATDALISLDPSRAIEPLHAILADASLTALQREQAAQQLSRIDRPEARAALMSQLKSAPDSVAVLIATGVAGNRQSAAELLKEIREGRAPATLLREPNVVDRLHASGLPGVDKQVAELTEKLAPKDSRIEKLIAQRKAGYLAGKWSPKVGREVFAKSVCVNCHRVGEVGKTIGPGLDGIGVRGLDRLLEDTLDPSRNVDASFRTVNIETEGGQILSGFGLHEEGKMLVFNDSGGQQIRIPLAEVVDRTQSMVSPMPGNVIEQIPEKDYYNLLAYLLSLKNKPQ